MPAFYLLEILKVYVPRRQLRSSADQTTLRVDQTTLIVDQTTLQWIKPRL